MVSDIHATERRLHGRALRKDGTFQVRCEESGRVCRSASVVDEVLLKSLLLSFLERDDSWSRQCKWETRSGEGASKSSALPIMAWAGIGAMVVVFALAWSRLGAWFAALFALAFPGRIAFAIVSKMREVRRAATWTKGNARILRSERITEERKRTGETPRSVALPAVEYEFSVGFDKFHGNRISSGEIMPNTPQVEEVLKRYPAGASVPAHYNPADPMESVLERDLPKHFAWVWAWVVLFGAIGFGAAAWLVGILK